MHRARVQRCSGAHITGLHRRPLREREPSPRGPAAYERVQHRGDPSSSGDDGRSPPRAGAAGGQPSGRRGRQPGGVSRARAAGMAGHDSPTRRWRHEYSHADVIPQALAGLESALRPTRVALAGHPAAPLLPDPLPRHVPPLAPDVAFVEAEPYALAAAQWGRALASLEIPFGVQCYENIDRPLPAPVRWSALARPARRGLRGGPLGQRGAARACVGGGGRGRSRPPGGAELGERAARAGAHAAFHRRLRGALDREQGPHGPAGSRAPTGRSGRAAADRQR